MNFNTYQGVSCADKVLSLLEGMMLDWTFLFCSGCKEFLEGDVLDWTKMTWLRRGARNENC